MKIQSFLLAFCLFLFAIGLSFCSEDQRNKQHAAALDVALQWNEILLELDRFSEGQRPPVSARVFAYMGLAAWESSRPAFPGNRSLVGRLPGFQNVPLWQAENDLFDLPVALNAAYAAMSKHFFPHAPMPLNQKYNNLTNAIFEDRLAKCGNTVFESSKNYGEAVAQAIFNWSATDSIGHQACLFNYDRKFEPQHGIGQWKPNEDDPMPALLPHWSKARTFVAPVSESKHEIPLPYSEVHGSGFFAQAMEVFNISQPAISSESRWIAEFWSDDFPGVTFSASSRWISIANQSIRQAKPDILTTLKIYLKIGLVLNDAAVQVWESKYRYNLERPDTYIRRNISPNWHPLHGTPSFPSYPSGHAAFAAATAAVLSMELGEHFAMTDRSHEGRKEFNGTPRRFQSFTEMAQEDAFSRIPMGVHYRMDCEEGLRIGYAIGEKVNALEVSEDRKLVRKD